MVLLLMYVPSVACFRDIAVRVVCSENGTFGTFANEPYPKQDTITLLFPDIMEEIQNQGFHVLVHRHGSHVSF